MDKRLYYQYVRERLGNGICPVCGKEFEKKTGNHTYCSKKCASKVPRKEKKGDAIRVVTYKPSKTMQEIYDMVKDDPCYGKMVAKKEGYL